jgi:hypothetical protein
MLQYIIAISKVEAFAVDEMKTSQSSFHFSLLLHGR